MGLYVEVMCDVMTEGYWPDKPLSFICWTTASDNPQGWTVGQARQAAREAKWRRADGKDICPGCHKFLSTPNKTEG